MKNRAIALLKELNQRADDNELPIVAAVRCFERRHCLHDQAGNRIRDERECGVTVLAGCGVGDRKQVEQYLENGPVPFFVAYTPSGFIRAERLSANSACFYLRGIRLFKNLAWDLEYLRDFYELKPVRLQVRDVNIELPDDLEGADLFAFLRGRLAQILKRYGTNGTPPSELGLIKQLLLKGNFLHRNASGRSETEMRFVSQEVRAVVSLLPPQLRAAGVTLISAFAETEAEMDEIQSAQREAIFQVPKLDDEAAKLAAFWEIYLHDSQKVWPSQDDIQSRRHAAVLAFLEARKPFHADQHDALVAAVSQYVTEHRRLTQEYRRVVSESATRCLTPGAFSTPDEALAQGAEDLKPYNFQAAYRAATRAYIKARQAAAPNDEFLAKLMDRI